MYYNKLKELFGSTLAPQVTVTKQGANLASLLNEKNGWEQFLTTIGKNTFTSPFADCHREFWDWYWQLTYLRKNKLPLTNEILTFGAFWARGMAKSSSVEWACITEGAMGIPGYVLYICSTQKSANEHVAEIRKRLESDDVGRYFPDLGEPKISKHGNQFGWRQDFLLTRGGWAIRPVGLDVEVRGLRVGDLRPTLIVLDDIDSHKASLHEVQKNLDIISRSILPAGTKNTIHLIAQNLISEHSAVNQIYTGKTDILSDHYPSFQKAFDDLEIETRINERTGRSIYEIKSATPTWESFDIAAAKTFLNKTGLEAFYAEYQHDFSLDQTDKVIPEYKDFPLHVITWDQFEAKFGTRHRVPRHWQVGVGLDIGYTEEHLSSWSWIGVAAHDSYLPLAHFRFRGLNFKAESINEQAAKVLETIGNLRDETGAIYDERDQYAVSVMSHEKKGERMELNRDYGFSFGECKFGKEDGVPQWRTLLRVDKHLPHPFHDDVFDSETNTWMFGRPNFFDVIDVDERGLPLRTDAGLHIHRTQLFNWKRRKVVLTATGIQDAIPMKFADDSIDSTRMLLAEENLSATDLTREQRLSIALKKRTNSADLTLKQGTDDYSGVLLRRQMVRREVELAEEAANSEAEQLARDYFIVAPNILTRTPQRF